MPKFAPMTYSPFGACAGARAESSGWVDARIGLETRRRNAGDRAFFVIVRGVARNADRPEDVTGLVADQHAAGDRHEPPVARGGERGEEHLRARHAPRQG